MAAEGTAPHLSVNVISMDLVAHMVAFGPVSDETEHTTAYALDIVMKHAKEAAAFVKALTACSQRVGKATPVSVGSTRRPPDVVGQLQVMHVR